MARIIFLDLRPRILLHYVVLWAIISITSILAVNAKVDSITMLVILFFSLYFGDRIAHVFLRID